MVLIISKFVDKLEDPKMPLLGPTMKILKFCGLLLPERKSKAIMYLTLKFLVFIFIVTQYVDIWLLRDDVKMLLQNTKYTMLSTVNMIKVITFIIWQKKWESVFDFVTETDLERRHSKDKDIQEIVKRFTKYCRTITYLYSFLTYCTVLMTQLQPLLAFILYKYSDSKEFNYTEVVHSWLPVDKATAFGYSIKLICQIYATSYAGFWMISFDANIFCLMIFFHYELELLKMDSVLIFGTEDSPVSSEEARRRLRKCHQRHNDLTKFTRLVDECLSPIMFLYVVVCSLMICATVFQINIEPSNLQKLITTVYLMFGLTQLFMYCWHSNEVYYVSLDLSQGPYQSTWWKRNVSEQKDINILCDQFSTPVLFSAGPFTNVTVATLVSILKGAYSYYTLLSNTD